jgi:hypothetical protein
MTSEQQHTQYNPDFSMKCSPRVPYTHVNGTYDECIIGCNKPYDPANINSDSLALCYCPCALVLDILCCIPMIFGCYNLKDPN